MDLLTPSLAYASGNKGRGSKTSPASGRGTRSEIQLQSSQLQESFKLLEYLHKSQNGRRRPEGASGESID